MRGKGGASCQRMPRSWDHPRVCGEKSKGNNGLTKTKGLPPRMRGKVVHHAAEVGVAGITPAYAGKSDIPHPTAHYGRQVVRGLCRHFKRA